jgi:hypothetical protein
MAAFAASVAFVALPAAGETMWVIFPPGHPGRAVVASLYY